jgi:hypothetical protein
MADARPYRFGIIDGTGPMNRATYAEEMKDSFCRQLFESNAIPAAYKNYFQGPSGDGFLSVLTAHKLYRWLLEETNGDKSMDIYLAGYSRGGWEAIIVAGWLIDAGRRVKALFLFDPVDKQIYPGGGTIPSRVEHAYVARRRYKDKGMDYYDHSCSLASSTHNPIRAWWKSTGTHRAGVPGADRNFLGSHGALGGVGWSHIKLDEPCQQAVAAFMTANLNAEGFQGLTLRSISRPGQPKKDWKRPPGPEPSYEG